MRMLAALLLLGWFAVAQAQDAAALARVQQQVAQVPVLRGAFQQQKQVAGFRNPLRSQGSFLMARERGVVWTTAKPFASELVLTRDRIVSRQRDGGSRIEVDGKEQPALRSVNAMMFALMSGDVKALTGTFNVMVDAPAGAPWRLRLTPKSRALAQAFTEVQLSGDRHVRHVEIREANGDVTTLAFDSLVEAPARLTAAEAARFD